jgi:hypothetical protein
LRAHNFTTEFVLFYHRNLQIAKGQVAVSYEEKVRKLLIDTVNDGLFWSKQRYICQLLAVTQQQTLSFYFFLNYNKDD